MSDNTIYNIDLGESILVKELWFTRVPGGWLVKHNHEKGTLHFVPYHNEFMSKYKNKD